MKTITLLKIVRRENTEIKVRITVTVDYKGYKAKESRVFALGCKEDLSFYSCHGEKSSLIIKRHKENLKFMCLNDAKIKHRCATVKIKELQ